MRRGAIAKNLGTVGKGLAGLFGRRRETAQGPPMPEPGSKELFDTGEEVIGLYRYAGSKDSKPTTRGIIHYGPQGCHIIPARPRDDTASELQAEHVCRCAQRALSGRTPGGLRAYSFQVDPAKRTIVLRAHLDAHPSADDLEEISVVESEIMADFAIDAVETITTDIEVVPVGWALSFLSAGIAWLRPGEAGTVHRHGQDPARSPLP